MYRYHLIIQKKRSRRWKENHFKVSFTTVIKIGQLMKRFNKEKLEFAKLAGINISMSSFHSKEEQEDKEPERPVEKEQPTGKSVDTL